jgi:large subunit ribosomal protein L16
MIFIPVKSKYKKQFKGKIYNQLNKNVSPYGLEFGCLGLKAIETGCLTSKNFEAIKQSIRKIIKKTGRVTFKCFPQTPRSKKPLEIRMGKGKGSVSHWVCKIQPGFTICEINTTQKNLGIKALTTAQFRLPIKTKLVFEK